MFSAITLYIHFLKQGLTLNLEFLFGPQGLTSKSLGSICALWALWVLHLDGYFWSGLWSLGLTSSFSRLLYMVFPMLEINQFYYPFILLIYSNQLSIWQISYSLEEVFILNVSLPICISGILSKIFHYVFPHILLSNTTPIYFIFFISWIPVKMVMLWMCGFLFLCFHRVTLIWVLLGKWIYGYFPLFLINIQAFLMYIEKRRECYMEIIKYLVLQHLS